MTTKPQKEAESKPVKAEAATVAAQETPKYDKEELLNIFDELVFSGEYIETLALREGKLKVSFRSRSVDDTTAITRDIDSKNFTLIATLQEYRALQNLAYSLVGYAGNDWSKLAVEDRVKKIGKLPAPIIGLLSAKLNEFDQKILAACEEGEANF